MSFILDALKKSESERQRQSGPDFAAVPRSTVRARRVPWPAIIAAILLVNAVVLGVLLLREPEVVVLPSPGGTGQVTALEQPGPGGREAADSGDAVALPGARTDGSPDLRPPPTRETPVHVPAESLAASAPVGPGPGASTAGVENQAGGATAIELDDPIGPGSPVGAAPAAQLPPGTSPTRGTPVPPPVDPPPATNRGPVRSLADEARAGQPASDEPERAAAAGTGPAPARPAPRAAPPPSTENPLALPTMQIAVAEGRVPGPVLNLDLHVWYPESSRRVVFIEGRKYREGDEITGGATLVEIVPEGAILEQRGQRFLLTPR